MQFKSALLSLLAATSVVHAVAIPSPLVILTPSELTLCLEEAEDFITAITTLTLQEIGFAFVDYGVCAACYAQALSSVIILQIVFQQVEQAETAFAASVAQCHA